jgi:hypothetical protein
MAAEPQRAGRRTVVLALAPQPGSLPGEIRPMYFACCYLVEARRFDYIDPRDKKEVARLIARLQEATEVVTFGGEAFGLRVLRGHHGLAGPVPAHGRHTDLATVPGARLPNIDPGAFAYDPENRRHARQACQAEARRIHRLWELHRAGVPG